MRASEVEVDRIASTDDLLRRKEPSVLVVGAELDDEGPIIRSDALERSGRRIELLVGVLGVSGRSEEGSMEHGSVGKCRAVQSGQNSPGL